jgi:hypothetical protein
LPLLKWLLPHGLCHFFRFPCHCSSFPEFRHFCWAMSYFTDFVSLLLPPSLLFPRGLELLSLESFSTYSFFPGLWPAGSRNLSVAHQRAGWQLSLPLENLGKFFRGSPAQTFHESALCHWDAPSF